jgi:hypothetical protein
MEGIIQGIQSTRKKIEREQHMYKMPFRSVLPWAFKIEVFMLDYPVDSVDADNYTQDSSRDISHVNFMLRTPFILHVRKRRDTNYDIARRIDVVAALCIPN